MVCGELVALEAVTVENADEAKLARLSSELMTRITGKTLGICFIPISPFI
jgi:hypothetical protein